MRVLIAGGGTGGHVFPALAVADELCASIPGSEVLFIGSSGGLEERLVPGRGYRLELLRTGKLRGASLGQRARTLAGLPLAGLGALRLVWRFDPDVVVGVGGYASGPVAVAAALLRRPVVLLEQNSVPGTTNRLLARLADRVVIAFRRAARALPSDRTLLLGNPVRRELRAAAGPARARAAGDGPCLLVLGGSQGARALNDLVLEAAPLLAARVPGLRIVHQTGSTDRDRVRTGYAAVRGIAARVEAFLEDMAAAYGAADLAVSRAGATTIAELCLFGVPALLVPYPFAADDHQAENAAEIAERGGAILARQQGLTARGLAAELAPLLLDGDRRARMGRAMRACAYADAASSVVQLLARLGRERRES